MALKSQSGLDISDDLIDAIRSFPTEREVEHCGQTIGVSPFDFYAECPQCGTRLKLRSFSGTAEIEDVFDAVLEWMLDPKARELALQRSRTLETDNDDD